VALRAPTSPLRFACVVAAAFLRSAIVPRRTLAEALPPRGPADPAAAFRGHVGAGRRSGALLLPPPVSLLTVAQAPPLGFPSCRRLDARILLDVFAWAFLLVGIAGFVARGMIGLLQRCGCQTSATRSARRVPRPGATSPLYRGRGIFCPRVQGRPEMPTPCGVAQAGQEGIDAFE